MPVAFSQKTSTIISHIAVGSSLTDSRTSAACVLAWDQHGLEMHEHASFALATALRLILKLKQRITHNTYAARNLQNP